MNPNTVLIGAALVATAALLYVTVTKKVALPPQASPPAAGLAPLYRPTPAPTPFETKVNSTASKLATAATTAKKLFDTGKSIFNGIKGLF